MVANPCATETSDLFRGSLKRYRALAPERQAGSPAGLQDLIGGLARCLADVRRDSADNQHWHRAVSQHFLSFAA